MSARRPTRKPADRTLVDVRVSPRAGRSAITGIRDGALHVRLAAAPVDGAANAELIAVLASALRVPRHAVEIVGGGQARSKRIRVAGLGADQVLAALGRPGEAPHS